MKTKQTTITPDSFTSPSPFHLEDNWQFRIENKNRNCTHNQIDALSLKGLLNPIDFAIMKLLAQYRYINTYNLAFALGGTLADCYQKEDYRRNLKKMVHAGILLKYCICLSVEGIATGTPVSPMRFYSLSPGAFSYISPLVENPYTQTCAIPEYRIMEQLALNQLLIRFHSSYKDHVRRSFCNAKKKIGAHSLTIDAFMQYQAYTKDQPHSVRLFLFCGRNHKKSHDGLVMRLLLFFRWLDQHIDEIRDYMIVILVENMQNIPEVMHDVYIQANGRFSYPLYFALDTNIMVYPLFDCLYHCSFDENSEHYVIKRIAIKL